VDDRCRPGAALSAGGDDDGAEYDPKQVEILLGGAARVLQ